MTGEDIIDCIMEVDILLAELESSLENKDYAQASIKLKETREAIDDLRQEDCVADEPEIETHMMNKLK
jgi:hypothetical protein